MRKKGIIVLLAVAVLFVLWSVFLSDRWLEKRIESLLGRVAGARVELDNFDFSLFSMRMGWDRLQFADAEDPWKNLFETGSCVLDLDSGAIFERKLVVEEMKLGALRFETDRATDGTLVLKTKKRKGPSKLAARVGDKLEKKLSELPLFDSDTFSASIDVDEIWRRIEPAAPGKIEALIEEYGSFAGSLNERFAGLDAGKELESVREDLDAIDVEALDTPREMEEAVSRLDRISRRLDASTRTVTESTEELEREIERLGNAASSVESWISDDLARIKEEVQVPRITLENVAEFLFGRRLTERVRKVLRIVEKFRAISAKIRRFVPVLEIPPRMAGQDISFERGRSLPAVWFKNVDFSSLTRDGILVSGSLKDFSSGQHLTGKPAVLEAAGGMEGKRRIVITGLFDWRESVPKDSLRLEMRDIVLQDMFLTDFPLVPNTIENGTAALNAGVAFSQDTLKADIDFLIEDVSFSLPAGETEGYIDRILHDVSSSIAADIDRILIEAELDIGPGGTALAIRSNLDTIVTTRVDDVLQREAARAAERLTELILSEVRPHKEALDGVARETEALVSGTLREFDGMRDEIEAEIEKKRARIEEKIEEQTVGAAKKELEEERRKQEEALEKERLEKEKRLEEEKRKTEDAIKSQIESLF